ncbi:MAG: HAMP domain-containing sensor histidine kinase [Pseudomonadota bacterium]
MAQSEDIASLAHDIRNILTPALLSVESLAGKQDTAETKHTDRIFKAIDKTVELCHDAMNANQAGPILITRKISLSSTIAEALELAVPQPKLRLEVSAETTGQDRIIMDTNSLCRMVFNLVRNASVAMAKTGGFVKVYADARNNALTVDVKDNGPGIPMNVLDRLFPSMFGRPSYSGRIGLGLPATAQMAAKLGGELILRSTSNQGTHFSIILPYRC